MSVLRHLYVFIAFVFAVGAAPAVLAETAPKSDRTVFVMVEVVGKLDKAAWSRVSAKSGAETETIYMNEFAKTLTAFGDDPSIKAVYAIYYLSYRFKNKAGFGKFVTGYLAGARKSGARSASKVLDGPRCVVVEMIVKTEDGRVPIYALLTDRQGGDVGACYKKAAALFVEVG